MIICGSAAEDNFSFEDLVDAECKVVQQMAKHYGLPEPATIKSLQEKYEIIYVYPVPTCIKAAALWALDSDVEVRIVRHISLGKEVPLLPEETCRSLCQDYGLNALSHNGPLSAKTKLMFMPKEAEKLGDCLFPLAHPLLDIITAVQRSTEEAVLQEAGLGNSK